MREGQLRRFVGGLGLGYLHAIVSIVVGLWLPPYLLHRVGTEDYGLWLLGAQVLAYLALIDLGVVALLPRELARATGSDGREGEPTVLTVIEETTALIAWQLPIVTIAGGIAWAVFAREWSTINGPLGLAVVAFVVTFPGRLFPAALQGLQDLTFLGMGQIAAFLAGTLLTLAAIEAGAGLYAIVCGWALTQATLGALIVVACLSTLSRGSASDDSMEVGWAVFSKAQESTVGQRQPDRADTAQRD